MRELMVSALYMNSTLQIIHGDGYSEVFTRLQLSFPQSFQVFQKCGGWALPISFCTPLVKSISLNGSFQFGAFLPL